MEIKWKDNLKRNHSREITGTSCLKFLRRNSGDSGNVTIQVASHLLFLPKRQRDNIKYNIRELAVSTEGMLFRKWYTHRHLLQQWVQICNKAIECINRIEWGDLQKYRCGKEKIPRKGYSWRKFLVNFIILVPMWGNLGLRNPFKVTLKILHIQAYTGHTGTHTSQNTLWHHIPELT